MSDITPDPLARPVAAKAPGGAAPAAVLPPRLNPRGYTKRRRRTPRILAWLAVVTSCLVLLLSGSLYAGYKKLDSNIQRINIPILDRAPDAKGSGASAVTRPDKAPGAEKDLNFLIIGSDSRAGATKAELQAFGTEFEAGQRSDTMLLVNIPGDRDGAYVLSFPRDLWVEIPGESGHHKINAAFSKGGANLAIQTVEALTEIKIDHYLEINFAAFLRMVDALDGVEICVPKAMRSRDAGLNLPAGTQKLNGSKALSYVRARNFDRDSEYKDGTADLGRIARQQQFLAAMIRRATSSSTLLRPDRLAKFLDRATSALTADEGLKTGDLQKLALRFRSLDPKKVVFASVPNFDPGKKVSGQNVLMVDEPAADDIFTALREGTMSSDGKIPEAPVTGPTLTVAPANIRLRVLNGTDVDGRAREAADDLKARGFMIQEFATAPPERKGESATVVYYGSDRKDAADTVVASIPDSRAELDETLQRTITVVVGSDYSGTKAVKVATPRASGSPSVQAAPKTAADNPCD